MTSATSIDRKYFFLVESSYVLKRRLKSIQDTIKCSILVDNMSKELRIYKPEDLKIYIFRRW